MRFNRGLADCGKWRRKCSWLFGRKESDNLPNTLISFTLRADFQSCHHSVSEFRWEHNFSKELKIQGEGTVKTSHFICFLQGMSQLCPRRKLWHTLISPHKKCHSVICTTSVDDWDQLPSYNCKTNQLWSVQFILCRPSGKGQDIGVLSGCFSLCGKTSILDKLFLECLDQICFHIFSERMLNTIIFKIMRCLVDMNLTLAV